MDIEAKPKKAPPKGIGIKPKKKTEDTDMADEAPPIKAPAKKGPALSSDKPRPATSTKGPSAPIIQDEDMGSGCSKEEAIDKVESFFDSGTVKKFEDAKWNIKCEGFTELQD